MEEKTDLVRNGAEKDDRQTAGSEHSDGLNPLQGTVHFESSFSQTPSMMNRITLDLSLYYPFMEGAFFLLLEWWPSPRPFITMIPFLLPS